jgi:hypothetical protein
MTTRRNLLIIAGGVAAAGATAVLTGRGDRTQPGGAAEPDAAVPDVLVADSRDGLVVLGGTRRHGLGRQAVASPDGRLVYAVTPGPTLVRLDPADGVPTRGIALGGGWIPRAVSADGRACALGRTPESVPPVARERTPLLVTTDGRQRRHDLAGVVEPDAFTGDGSGLFVLQWLPAEAPDRYRVRLLDLATGALRPLLTRTKLPVPEGAEEEMRGGGRQAVLAPGGQVLYTLYTHQPGHRHTRDLVAGRPGNVHAFVHVLHLTERWAYCLDLPHPFGEGPAAGHALAVTADGRQLAVLDVTSGSLAYADTTALAISAVVSVPAGSGAASLALTPDGRRALAGAGPEVTVLDRGTGAVTARWPVPGPVRGLGLSPDAARVYAGGTDEVVWLDAGTGTVRGRAAVGGLTVLRHVR